MKVMYVLIVGLAVMALAAGDGVKAREWSDEIRMTYAGELHVNGSNLRVEVDSRNDIHVFYGYFDCPRGDTLVEQPIYQKFNRYGESLTEPLNIAEIAGAPDTLQAGVYDMAIDRHDNLYLLWAHWLGSDQDMHITVLNRNGEVIEEDIVLSDAHPLSEPPIIVIDSDGNIVLLGLFVEFLDEGYRLNLCYARFTPEGDMQDTLRVLYDRNGIILTLGLEIDSNENLHAVWKVNAVNRDYSVHYSKISADDELIVDDYSLQPVGNLDHVHFTSVSLDNTGNPVLSMNDYSNGQPIASVVSLDDDLEYEFITAVGLVNSLSGGGEIGIDDNDFIHDIENCDDDSIHPITFIGYAMLNDEGEIIDSLQVVHDRRVDNDEDAIRPAAWSSDFQLAVFDDGGVAVIWCDKRYGVGSGRQPNGYELFMRYCEPFNSVMNDNDYQPRDKNVLLRNYPNPFNGSTFIQFENTSPGFYRIEICDILGRIVYENNRYYPKKGLNEVLWKGCNMRGDFVPGGVYLFTVSNKIYTNTIAVYLVR